MPMVSSTMEDDPHDSQHGADAPFHCAALLVRACLYGGLYAFVDRYDCGGALLTGLLLGDLVGHLVSLAWQWRDGLANALGEFTLFALVFVCVRAQLVWPEEPAMRAILALAAFGVFSARVGGSLLAQLGPGEVLFRPGPRPVPGAVPRLPESPLKTPVRCRSGTDRRDRSRTSTAP
jgi:hypothetical protein